MTAPRDFKKKLAGVFKLWQSDDYDAALAQVEQMLEKWSGNSQLHVLKGCLIQLQETPTYELEDARKSLQLACELDETASEPLLELGHYLDAIEDDPQGAIKAYAEAATLARRHLIDTLIAQFDAYSQLDMWEEAHQCFREVIQLSGFIPAVKSGKSAKSQSSKSVRSKSEAIYFLKSKDQMRNLIDSLANRGSFTEIRK